MKLTPLDIRKQEFKKVMRGYDPVEVDTTSYSNKVVLHPMDMLQSPSVRQVTLIFRGIPDSKKLAALGKTDLILYVS